MKKKISFMSAFAIGLGALAIAFSSTTASAQSKSWTRGAGPTNVSWSTSGNWSPSGAPATNGTQITFSSAGNAPGIINITGSTVRLGNSTIQGGTYNFAAGTLFFGGATLTNNGTAYIQNLSINSGNILTVAGTGVTTINNLTSSSTINEGMLAVKSAVNWGGSMTNKTGVEVGAGGTLTLSGAYINASTTLSNSGGVLKGKGDGTNFFTTLNNGFVMQNDGATAPTTTLFISDATNFDRVISEDPNGVAAGATFAGTLNVDLGLVNSALPDNAQFPLFSFDPTAKIGSFTTVNLANVAGGAYDGLSFAGQGGGVWQTGVATNGQYMVFNENTGYLSVVPEPSTIAFAGIVIGMAGWSARKKRRLAKVLAKK
ncbi:MAG: PEP-CTERM sorting domain-containing protein [Planctomycetes bacterium]|nr:PEP-CTERM sorting domain-containing protein [Planctomycetota bacterium]